MEVIILAGGLGTRLRSTIGNEIPKCMAPIAGRPFLWYLLKYLTRYKVSHVVLSVGHLRHTIIDWIDKYGAEFPFVFDYSVEKTPLGTGGGIKLALSKTLENDVLVLNGDTYFDVDLNSFYEQHCKYPSAVSLALKPMERFDRYGAVEKNECHIIEVFREKRYCKAGLINGGVYLINKQNTDYMALPTKFSFEKEVLEPGVQNRNIYGFDFRGYFIDIGIPEDYVRANDEFLSLFKV